MGGRLGKGALPPPLVVVDSQAYVPLWLPPGYPGGLGDESFGLGVDGGGLGRFEVFSNICPLHLLLWHTLINPWGVLNINTTHGAFICFTF